MSLRYVQIALMSLLVFALISGCGILGPNREQRVIQGLRSRDEAGQLKVLRGLQKNVTPAMREPLEEVLQSGINPTARAMAADKLGMLGSEQSVPVLRLSARRDSSWTVRRRALRSLGNILEDDMTEDLQHVLKRDSQSVVRVEAVDLASQCLDGRDLKDTLLLALKDESLTVRIVAQQKLKQLTGEEFPPGDYKRWEKALEQE